MTDIDREPLPARLVVGMVVAAVVAVSVTAGLGEAVLLGLALGLLTTGYLARRYVRDALLYRDRNHYQCSAAEVLRGSGSGQPVIIVRERRGVGSAAVRSGSLILVGCGCRVLE